MLIVNFLAAVLLFAGQGADQVSDARKEEFIDLLRALPTNGEFYTDEAVVKAGPYLPKLLAVTEKDVEKYEHLSVLSNQPGPLRSFGASDLCGSQLCKNPPSKIETLLGSNAVRFGRDIS